MPWRQSLSAQHSSVSRCPAMASMDPKGSGELCNSCWCWCLCLLHAYGPILAKLCLLQQRSNLPDRCFACSSVNSLSAYACCASSSIKVILAAAACPHYPLQAVTFVVDVPWMVRS
jgi:hypothetical protein